MTTNRPLRVFLCHSSADKPAVRELYQKLRAEPWIDPWLDEEELFPGMDWNMEIEKAIEATDVILVCLSNNSITKEGYVQKEITKALDFADYKPEGTLFIIPVRLEECIPPKRLARWQYADYFAGQREQGFSRLVVSLKSRAGALEIYFKEPTYAEKEKNLFKAFEDLGLKRYQITLSNGVDFMRVPAGNFIMGNDYGSMYEVPQHIVEIPYDYWMARFPVTNEQYNQFILPVKARHPVDKWEKIKDHPVTNVNWNHAMSYCAWLNDEFGQKLLDEYIFRLPTEAEWEKAARGTDGYEYPWGNAFDSTRSNFANFSQTTTPVMQFSPRGNSTYGCADMVGNVWEWCHSLYRPYPYKLNDGREEEIAVGARIVRGGSFGNDKTVARCAFRNFSQPENLGNDIGFRVVLSHKLS